MCAGATQTHWYGCEGMVVCGSVSNYFFPDLINLKRWRRDADCMRWWSDGGQWCRSQICENKWWLNELLYYNWVITKKMKWQYQKQKDLWVPSNKMQKKMYKSKDLWVSINKKSVNQIIQGPVSSNIRRDSHLHGRDWPLVKGPARPILLPVSP